MSRLPAPPSSYDDPAIAGRSLEGRRVVVVGGSSGIGRQVALDAALAGADVIVVGLDPAKAHATSSEAAALGRVKASALAFDATTEEGHRSLIEVMGSVDHVVSTLGGRLADGVREDDEAAVARVADRKVADNLGLVEALAPHVRDGGSFVLTAGSTRHHAGGSVQGAVAGNAAIAELVREQALALAPRVRVNAVAPTWTQTTLWRDRSDADVLAMRAEMESRIPLQRTAEIQEVARAYVFLMSSDFVTGQTLAVDGGYSLVSGE